MDVERLVFTYMGSVCPMVGLSWVFYREWGDHSTSPTKNLYAVETVYENTSDLWYCLDLLCDCNQSLSPINAYLTRGPVFIVMARCVDWLERWWRALRIHIPNIIEPV